MLLDDSWFCIVLKSSYKDIVKKRLWQQGGNNQMIGSIQIKMIYLFPTSSIGMGFSLCRNIVSINNTWFPNYQKIKKSFLGNPSFVMSFKLMRSLIYILKRLNLGCTFKWLIQNIINAGILLKSEIIHVGAASCFVGLPCWWRGSAYSPQALIHQNDEEGVRGCWVPATRD